MTDSLSGLDLSSALLLEVVGCVLGGPTVLQSISVWCNHVLRFVLWKQRQKVVERF